MNSGVWTYVVDPAGITLFTGEFHIIDLARLDPNTPQVNGLQGFTSNVNFSSPENGRYVINGQTNNTADPTQAVTGAIFDISFDALDAAPNAPTVRWFGETTSGHIASGFDTNDQTQVFDDWDVTFPVPEPGSLLLAMCGIAGLMAVRPRRRV